MPIFIPIVVLSLEPQFYFNKSKSQCSLVGPPLYILYIIPITLMLLVNIGFVIASLINILKKPIVYYDKTKYRLNQILFSILNSFLMCMTWLVSFSLLHELNNNNNNDNASIEVIFCIGLVIHGHFIFLFHIFLCKSKKGLLFQNNKKHKLNTLLNLINKNEKDKICDLNYKNQNIFTIPLQMDNFTIKPRTTILTNYDDRNNTNFQSFDSNINSLSYLYTNSNKNRIKKKFLSSKSSLASSISFLSNKRKQLCNKLYKRQNRTDANINKRFLSTYNNTNNNDVPSRINRLNDSFKRIKYKTRKSKLIQNPFDFSSITSQSNSSPSQNNSPMNSTTNNERALFIKSNSFKLTHHLPDSLFLE